MVKATQRPVRVAGASGGFSDRVHAISRIAKNEDVDVIVGDWLSEMTMTMHVSAPCPLVQHQLFHHMFTNNT